MKTMKINSLIRVLAVATALSGPAFAAEPNNPSATTDDGGGAPPRKNEATAPGNPDESGWRQTQAESDAQRDGQARQDMRKSGEAMKKAKDPVEGEDWRDSMREGEAGRDGRKLTAQDAGKSAGDREIARQTRRAVVSDKTLSSAAHNVKIITRSGTVTLKGRVNSEVEKRSIVEKAAAIVGPEHVVDKLTVKTPKSK